MEVTFTNTRLLQRTFSDAFDISCVPMFIKRIVCVCVFVCFAGTATSVSWLNISSPCALSTAARPLLWTVLSTAVSPIGRSLCQNWTWMHYCRHTLPHILRQSHKHIYSYLCSLLFQRISKGFFPACLNTAFDRLANCSACLRQ